MTSTDDVACLLMAKSPVPGMAKTRLGATVGMARAADLAAAALLDTVDACAAAFPGRCRMALAGELAAGVRAGELGSATEGWAVVPQSGDTLGERLAHAHGGVAGPVIQIGMDTPQVTPEVLRETARGLGDHDAVLGPAEDGGWWVLAMRDSTRARVLRQVPMSTSRTYDDTLAALRACGLVVAIGATLRDVDEESDARAVAGEAPQTRFAQLWGARPG